MTTEEVHKVIRRAVTDEAFRNLLFNSPDQALSEFDLTTEEIGALRALDRESLGVGAGELEARISKSLLIPGGERGSQEDEHKDW